MKVMIHIGLDVHNDSIAVSIAPSDSTAVRRWGIRGTHEHVQRFIKQPKSRTRRRRSGSVTRPGRAAIRSAASCGLGNECLIVVPGGCRVTPATRPRRTGAMPINRRPPRVGTGRHPRAGAGGRGDTRLRSREQVRSAQHRARQQLKMFLLRHNIRYSGTTSWTPAHLRYLARIKMPFPTQQFALQELMSQISELGQRLERYGTQLEREVAGWRWEPAVRALMSLRRVALLNATILVAELGDLNRFTRPQELMGYLGLVPSEHTTGADRQQGGLTKMGNGHARRALVEAAHHYRAPARLTPHLQKRQEGLPKGVTDAAWEAQRRLHHRYKQLSGPGRKKAPVVIAALARELSGFVWAIARQVKPHPKKG